MDTGHCHENVKNTNPAFTPGALQRERTDSNECPSYNRMYLFLSQSNQCFLCSYDSKKTNLRMKRWRAQSTYNISLQAFVYGFDSARYCKWILSLLSLQSFIRLPIFFCVCVFPLIHSFCAWQILRFIFMAVVLIATSGEKSKKGTTGPPEEQGQGQHQLGYNKWYSNDARQNSSTSSALVFILLFVYSFYFFLFILMIN